MSPSGPQAYNFDDFVSACKEGPSRVFVWRPAIKEAEEFNLRTASEILEFIGNKGYDEIIFKSSHIWKGNPNPKITIMIDSYKFRTLNKSGYLAFMGPIATSKWQLKSFKMDHMPDTHFFPGINTLIGE